MSISQTSDDLLLRKAKKLREELIQRPNLVAKKIAILGGSTTDQLVQVLELFLLEAGIKPTFYQSNYNRYFEDVIDDDSALYQFQPEIVYLHTTIRNIRSFPTLNDKPDQVKTLVALEMAPLQAVWKKLGEKLKASVIQNNFDLPPFRPLGNLEFSLSEGKVNYVTELNREIAIWARTHSNFYVQDIGYLSAAYGLEQWHDLNHWYAYKYAMSVNALPKLARNLSSIISSILGKSKKCLVLDLDNTLWGGIIGDDGAGGISLGPETPLGEAYRDFQSYCRSLKARGILLAVCSKNEEIAAKSGFNHPDSVLQLDDFAAFKANWEPKPDNLVQIAQELNIGLDSLVFVDDSRFEREMVRKQLPQVSVPEIGEEVTSYVRILEEAKFFESVSISAEDQKRAQLYILERERESAKMLFSDYNEYLKSLEMRAEIRPFSATYLDRITQLINKTNQFNLTTVRLTGGEVSASLTDPNQVTLYGRLADKFGDHGLISVVAGNIEKQSLKVSLWLMSCRVLKRGMELAMFNALLMEARKRGLKHIQGHYLPTAKNAMVAKFYEELGFRLESRSDNGGTIWGYDIQTAKTPAQHFISVNQEHSNPKENPKEEKTRRSA